MRTDTHRAEVRSGAFAVIGDTQQFPVVDRIKPGGSKERAAVRAKIAELDPDATVLAGDVVGCGCWKPFWTEWRREYDGMLIHPVIGNHDMYGPNRYAPRKYFETFPHLDGRRWYELRHGDVLLLMLDSNRGEMRRSDWQAQLRWLDERLAAADRDESVRCVGLVCHHPPLSSHGWTDAPARALYAAGASHEKVRLHFAGHHHAYQHIEHGRRHVFISGGGGAPVYLRPDPGKLPAGARLACAVEAHHVLHCRRVKRGLRVEMHQRSPDGSWRVGDSVDVDF